MKNIAVLVYDLINSYSCAILEGITGYFKDKEDVHFIIAPVYVPHATESEYSYQYWTTTKLLESKEIDSVIIVSNTFTNYISLEYLAKNLKGLEKKKIVSVAVPLELNNCKHTHTVCEEAYDIAVNHFVEKHNCKKFAFFSAALINAPESEERLAAFKKALEKHGIPFSKEDVLDGDFTPGTAGAVFTKRFAEKENRIYDVVFCVNDYTAAGCIKACRDLNIKIPEEMKIIGFDDCDIALLAHPTLSSINQSLYFNGFKAGEIALKMANGDKVQKETFIQTQPVFRQTCGCVKTVHHSSAFVDVAGEYHNIDEKYRDREIDVISNATQSFINVRDLLNIMDSRFTFERASQNVLMALSKASITAMVACFYEEPIMLLPEEEFELPETAKVIIKADLNTGLCETEKPQDAEEINLQKRIVPEDFDKLHGGKYLIAPIYTQEQNYGYIVYKTENSNYPVVSIYLKLLNNLLIRTYEYTKERQERQMLISQQQKLNLESKTDELTQIFNRRGFMEYGQRLLALSAASGKPGMVFFCDLDGLKTINDTYGHEVGDAAIITEAQVLAAAFRNSDLIGRLSGDEFGVIAPGFTKENVQKLRDRLVELNELYSVENELPFILSISVGPIEFGDDSESLEDLLKKADENLYEEKKIKHSKDKDYYKNRLIKNPKK